MTTLCRQWSDPLVVRYVDADYARDLDGKRSSIGYVYSHGGETYLLEVMHSLVVSSTTESEYMAIDEVAKEELWLVGLAKEGILQGGVQLHCNS